MWTERGGRGVGQGGELGPGSSAQPPRGFSSPTHRGPPGILWMRKPRLRKVILFPRCKLGGSHNREVFSLQLHEKLSVPRQQRRETYTVVHRGLCAVVQSFSRVQLFAAPWTAACQASLPFTLSRSLLKLSSTELVTLSNHLIFCRPLLLLPSVFTRIRVFSNELVLCIRWPKYCSSSFSISPSTKYSGLISFRMDWFDLMAVQRTLKSLL